ncbi:histone-lysine N-methyltransferase SETMAR-like [Centruroides vittatus]|uniref:histone-lysine N-methyltransferase SETMAR-like n=1 Tax=Centruroides vittatus TaxID=120091 RepID=UPI00351028CF
MDKKGFRAILLLEFKVSHKASEATCYITKSGGEKTVNERTVQLEFKKFQSGDMSLDDKDHSERPPNCDDDRLKASVVINPRKTIREIAKELNISIATVSRHLDTMGEVKKLDKWLLHELNESQQTQWYDKEVLKHAKAQSPPKDHVTVWWSAAGVIHYNFFKTGETITAETCCRELDIVQQKLSQMQSALVNRKGFHLIS